MTVHIARFHTCVSVFVLAVLLPSGPVIAQEDTVPAEKPPAVKPAEAAPVAKPTEAPPAAKPAEAEPAVKPAEKPPAAKPAEAAPVAKPTEEPPAAKPTEEEAPAKPTEEPPPVKKAEEPPAAKPVEKAPAVKPAEKPPAAKPEGAAPPAKPTEEPPPAKKAEEPPAAKPVEKAPAVKPAEKPPAAKPDEVAPPAKPKEEPPAAKPAEEATPAKPTEEPPPAKKAEEPAAKPVEDAPPAKPADDTPKTPVVEEVVEEPPTFDQLGDLQVAQQLGLSAEQNDRIADLLEKRAAALAAATGATDEERAAIIEESEQKLAAVLTEVQRGDFLGKPVEKRLRFMCRFQQWDEVLTWFAEQAEMSLVLEYPPKGTFNYTDTREYTPKEAIDMLNGVLITKGFTLIRRGRMLMVIDLTKDIPDGLVEQVALEDIDKYGKFELVTVQFSLGRRSSTSVETAIKPVLSPYHKIVSVAATQQMFVTDMAGNMQAANEIIEAIPEPVIKPTPTPSKPEPPIVEVYPLVKADPDTALKVLQAMVPTGTLVLDPKLKQINAHAPPSQQNLIKQVLERMEAASTEETQETLELYPIESFLEADSTGSQLLATLQPVVADAQLSINAEKKTLVVWATPTEHEKIKSVIEKLQGIQTPRRTAQLEVHRLFRVDPETTLSLFETILPDARLAVDTKTRNLIALAVPDDQEVIRSTLKILQPTEPGPDTPELRYYELTLAMPPDFPENIKKVAPDATMALDQSGMRLMVIASPAEHAKVEKTLQIMQKTTFQLGRPKLVFYPVTPAQRRRFESVWQSLSKELPGVSLVTDGAPGELAIWARPHQHEVIVGIMEEFKRDVPVEEKYLLLAYPIQSDDPSGVVSMLETLYPETKIVSDAGGERLLVWTSQQEHESIKKSLEELKVTGSEATPTVEIYPLTKADPTSTLTLLQSLVPDATISVDAKSENIVALAMAEDHLTIKTTMEKLQPDEPDVNKPQLQFYAFPKEPPANLVTILQAQSPRAEITVDSENRRLVVRATPSDHEAIKSTIDKYQEATPADGQPELAVYPIKSADATSALTLLQNLVPDAQLSLDAKSENIHAVAVAKDQETIKKAIETLESAAGPDAAQLQFYPFPDVPPDSLVSLLQTQSPKANITIDSENKRLVVLASPTDQEAISSIVQKYQDTSPSDEEEELVVYPIKDADPTSAMTLLQKLAPDADLSLDTKNENMTAIAVPSDHEIIKKTLDTLETAAAGPDSPQLQFYAFPRGPPAELVSILQTQSPKANITVEADNKRLVVLATPADHEAIKAIIQKYEEATPDDGEANLAVYPIKSADPTSVLSMLQQLYPDRQILLDTTGKRLLVLAKAEDQALIKASLEQLTGASAMETPQLEIYRLTKVDPNATLTLLQKLVPDAQLTLDSNTNNLIALAVPEDQQVIKSTIEQLQPAATDPDTPALQFHLLSRAPSDNLVSVLQNLAPQAQITADAENERLMVVATAADHEMIKGVIEEFEASTPPVEKGKLAVYPVTQAQRRRFEAALETLTEDLPSVQVLPTSEPGELAIWAKPTEHLQVTELLKQLEADVPLDEKPQLVAYTLKAAEPAAVSEVLTKLFPDIEVVTDEKTRKVMVWAPPADQPRISAAVQQIDSGEPGQWEQIFKAHAVPDADLTVALQMVQQLLPEVTFTSDTTAGTILAWATKADHDKIAKMLEELQAGVDKASTAVIYALEGAEAQNVTSLLTLLGTAYPNARFSAGTQPGQVVAWANSKDHEQIKTLIEQMGQSSFSEVSAALYHLKSITAANAEQILQTAVPGAKAVLDADNPKRLIVWARQSEHETIDGILKEIDVEGAAETSSKAVIYTLQGMDATGTSYAITFLTSAFPEARFTQGIEPGQVAAWASPKEHEQIKALVDQLSQKSTSDVSVYLLKSITAASAVEVLQSALPQAKFTADTENPRRLTAWASQADQEKIKTIIEKIDVESTDDPDAPKLQFYDLDEEPPASLVTILQSLAPDAEVTADAENKRLAVLASPADQEKIKAAVEQFQQASPATGKPVLAVHTIRSADPSSVLSMLQTLYPKQQFVLDAKTNRLMVFASPEDQKSITESLEQITGSSGDQQSRFQPYPIRGITTAADATTLVSTLQPLVPDAKLTVGADYKNLIVWATPTDHDVIRQAVEQLGHGASAQNTPQLEVYHLTKADPDTTLALLQKLVPDAQLSLDPQTKNLVSLAVPGDQQVIKATLEQLQPGASGPHMPELRFHSLSREPTDDLVSVLKELVPQARITADAENKRLTVVATPEDHDAIKKVVEEYEASTPLEERATLMIYPATPAQQRRFELALSKLAEQLPSVQVLPNSEPGELAIWAVPTEHIQVAELLKRLEGDTSTDDRPRLAAYTLKAAEPAAVSELITKLFPDVDVVIDEKTRKVMVWARLEDQGRISEAIEQIDSGGKPGDWEETFKAYPLPNADTTVATQMLQQLLPDVRFSSDATAGTILAWGTKKDHETIAQMLEEMQAAPVSASAAVVYTLEGADATNTSTIVTFLGTAFPNARFTLGAQPGQLVAWASSKDQEQIKSLIDQLTEGADGAPKVAVYDLKSVTAASAQQIVQTAVPQATITVDPENPQRLTVWARPSEHETIASIVEEIDVEGDAKLTSKAVVYTLEGMDAAGTSYAVTFLTSTFPKARFTQGVEPGQVVAWASAKEHEGIKTLVDQLTQKSSTDVAVYSLKSITAASALEVLQTAVPQAKLTVDSEDPQRLTAFAKSEEHEAIKRIIETIDVAGATDSAPKAVIYTLDRMDATAASNAVSFLTAAFPSARFVTAARPGQVVAWATPKDHAEIKNLVDQMIQEPDPDDAPKVAVYDLKFITPASAQQILQTAVPQATITVDAENPQRLTVWARPSEQETIAGIVQEIDIEGDAEPTSQAVVYTLKGMDVTSTSYAVTFLTGAFPKARFTQGVEPGQVVAWASAKEHEGIKTLVDQLTQASTTDVAVYSLKSITAASALEVLQSAVPQAKLTVDADDPQRLTALAKSEDHEAIKKILETIDVEGATELASRAVVYSLKGMDATGTSYALTFLTNAFPKARFTQGVEPGQVVAWASAKEHQEIKTLVDQLTQTSTTEAAVYSLKSITAASALEVLQSAVPQAKLTVDSENPRRLTAVAKPEEHEALKKIIETIDVEGDMESTSTAVVYTLEGMDASSSTNLLPFLSGAFPKAQFSLGVEPGQVVAWAATKEHEQIRALIDQLGQTGPDAKPDVAVYSLKFITASDAMQVLQTAVPQAQFTPNASDPQRLTAWARASHQEAIKNVLEIIDVESDAESSSKAVIYAIKGMDSRTGLYKLRFLSNSFPKANFTLGAESDQIVAWATAKDHEEIKNLIDQFGEEAASEIVVYSLKNITATNASTVLRTAVPQAEITVDADNPQRFTAWARQEDHDAIQKILTTIDIEGDADSSATVVVYNLEGMSRSGAYYAVNFLSTTFPKARFTAGAEAGQIVAWASAKDHEQIKTLVDQMTKEPETDVAVYSLKSITAASAMQVLLSAVPKAKLTPDTDDPQRLTAVASTADHEAIKKILETIDVEGAVDSEATAVIYTIKGMDARSGYYKLLFLNKAFPTASFVQGTEGDQIVAWATAKDHEKIKSLIDQFGEEAASEIVVYSLKNITAANASRVLGTAVPQAEITVDTDNPQRLTAWARQEDHAEIEKVLATIDIEGAADSAATVMIYTLEGVDTYGATYAVRFLTSAFPKARIVSGAQPGQVVAWATPKDHAEIKALIDQMSQGPPKELAPKLTVYGLKFISAANASQVLQTALPQAKFTVSTDDPQRLSAWARPSEHETIDAILQELDIEGDADTTSTAVVYTMEGMSYSGAAYAVRFLTTAFPKARFTAGAEPGQVVAWASAKDHEQIKALVDQMTEEPETDVAVYSLKAITAASATQVLQSAVPNAKLTADAEDPQRLTAVASSEDHEAIKKIIETIDVEGAVDSAAMAVIYTIKGMDTRSGYYKLRFLSNAFPNANFTMGAEGDQIVAWATAKDQEKIKKLIDQFGEEAASELVVYSLKNISATNASSVLRTAVPQAEITVDADNPQRLTAWARQEDHDTIQKVLATIDIEDDADSAATVAVYRLDGMTSTGAIYAVRFLTSTFPKARFTVGAQPGQVVAWASAKDHTEIKALVDQMTEEPESDVTVYSLKAITAASAVQVLQSAVPNAKLTADTDDPQRLTAVASTQDHEAIKKIIDTIDVEGAPDSAATAVIYTMKGMDARSGYYRLTFLSTAFPSASFTQGAEADQIVAWATAKDHEKIKSLIDQFDEEAASEVIVYSLKNIPASDASTVLQTAVPQAEITVGTDNPQRLTAWARQEDHDTIQKILTTIDVEDEADALATVVVYTLKSKTIGSAVYAVRFLTETFPKARFTLSVAPGKVVAWASAKDHEEIRTLIDKINEEPESDVALYSLKSITAASAIEVLQSAVPDAELTADTDDPQRLTAWAEAADHHTIKKVLETIDVEGAADSAATAVIYTLKGVDASTASSAVTFLADVFPKARIVSGAQPDQVVAWATPKDHEEIKSLVEKFGQETAAEIVLYTLKNISASSASTVLQTAVPQAKLTVDIEDPQRLTAFARPSDHEAIQAILDKIDVESDAAFAAKVVIYTLEGMDETAAGQALDFLTATFPDARFALGAEAGQMVAWAAPKDHQEIKALVDQLNQGPSQDKAPKASVYALKNISAADAMQVLEAAVPQAIFTAASNDQQRLTAWARPSEHDTITAILAEIDIEGDAESASKVAVYSLEGMDARSVYFAVRFLTGVFPNARFTQGAKEDQVVAWATAKDQEEIKSLIDQLGQAEATEVVIYTLERTDTLGSSYTLRFLTTSFPTARFTVGSEPGQLVAWASAKDHEQIKALIDQLNQGPPPDKAQKITVYTVKNITAASAMQVLAAAVPMAKVTVDAGDPQRLTVWARPSEHQMIDTILQDIDVEGDPESVAKAVVYTMEGMSTQSVSYTLRFLSRAFPGVQFAQGAQTDQVVAWATAKDHEKIQSLIDQFGEEAATEIVVYTLEGMDPRFSVYTTNFLSTTFPKAQFTVGTQPGQVVARASAEDHVEIKALIDQMNQGPPPTEAQATVYTVKNISAQSAIEVLTSAVPMAKLSVDASDPQRLTAWARPSEHQMIDAVLQDIDVEGDPESTPKAVVYTMEGMDARSSLYTLRFLGQAFPDAQFTQAAEADQVVAWASAKDHEKIESLVEQLGQEAASEVVLYTLQNIAAASAAQVLQTAVPEAEVTVDAEDPQRLTAWARATDHDTIKTILERIDLESDPDSGARVMIYTLEGMDPRYATYTTSFLTATFPKARFTMGTQPGQLIAWATAKDHEEIKALIDQMNQGPPPDQARGATVYMVKNISAADAIQVLENAVPLADFSPASDDPQRLTALARPSEHEMIDAILGEIDVEGDPESASKAMVYTMEGMDSQNVTSTLTFLGQAFPDAQFAQGAQTDQVVAWASAKDHEKIKSLVEQLGQESASQIVVYMLKNISGNEAVEVLQSALPEAVLTLATDDPKRLTAWARPLDHQKIADILKEIDMEADPALAARAAIYVLEGMSRTHAIYAVRFLQQAVPDANLTLGSDTTQLIAWASPKDHETLKELVRQLIEESDDSARTAKVYSLKHATAEIAIQTLSAALPEATLNPGADPSQVIAWARPKDHQKIETIIEQLETKGPEETEPQAVVYTVPVSDATEAIRILRETVPQAKLTTGSEPHQVIAWARPADHEVIAQLVEKMGEKGPDELAPRVAVYKVEAGDAADAIAFLEAAVPNADFSVGSDARRVIAWASPKDHEVIKKAVDELTLGADQISTHVYRFQYADPAAAEAVLSTLVPTANIALDQNDGSLVVSAMPEDHAKIQAVIDEMDSEEAGGQRPVVKVHPITVGDPANVYQSLLQLFSTDTSVQLSLDEQNDAVLAVAPAAKHKRIDDMIKAVAEVAQEDDNTTVALYSMKSVDSSATDVLDQLLAKQSSKAEVTYDYMSNQLIAIGRPEDHELIKKTLEQLRTEETTLEIYELQYVDPMSAEMAISRQYADEGMGGPRVDVDPNSEQLFIRATAEQQQEIRELLIKMGETKLKLLKGRSGQIMRTYRTQGDITEALREIQRLWPQLRDNEIRIVSPDEPLPEERAKEATTPPVEPEPPKEKPADKTKPAPPAKAVTAAKAKPAARAKPKASPKEKPAEQPKEAASPGKPAEEKAGKPKPGKAAKKNTPNKTSLLDDSAWGDEWFFVAQIQADDTAKTDGAKSKSPPVVEEKPAAKEPPKPAEPAPKQPPEPKSDETESKPPPLYVVPGEGSITVVSDDPEALQQFEQLLRTILPSAGQIGRNISVIELENASAPEVAERLQQLFGDERSSWRRGALPVAIVPDERLNTIVVQGSRIDRETIEGLVRVLDSDQGEGTKPQIVPLRYADAVEVSKMIQEVFRSQLMSTTSSSRSRAYGASTSRRRPGVAVDEMTNSLVVMATSPLLEKIIELAQTLDERAGESPARQIKIIPLKKASASRVEEALQRILNSRSGTTRTSR